MKQINTILTSGLIALVGGLATDASAQTRIVIEAENGQRTSQMLVLTNQSAASNAKAVRVPRSDSYSSRVTFGFRIQSSKTYYLWARVLNPYKEGQFLVTVNGTNRTSFVYPRSTVYTWRRVRSTTLSGGGTRQISFQGANDDSTLDEVLLTDSSSFVPVGKIAQNTTVGGSSQPAPTATPSTPTPVSSASSCLNSSSGRVVTVSGVKSGTVRVATTETLRYDLRGAKFEGNPGVVIAQAPNICLSGGVYDDGTSDTANWETHFHHAYGLTFSNTRSVVVDNTTILQSGDAFSMRDNVGTFRIANSYVRHAGDDTIENDRGADGVIENVLFDWSYTGFSCRKDRPETSARANVTIKGVLLAMRPQRWGYKDAQYANGPFWKQTHNNSTMGGTSNDFRGCTYTVQDSVFLLPNSISVIDPASATNLSFDPINDAACDGHKNIIVMPGASDAKVASMNKQNPRCFSVTNDKRVWDAARNKWFDKNPQFRQYRDDEPRGAL